MLLSPDIDTAFLRFRVQRGTLTLVRWEGGDSTIPTTVILPDGAHVYRYQPPDGLLWSGPLGPAATFTLKSGQDGPTLEDSNNTAISLLRLNPPYHPEPFQTLPDTIYHLAVDAEQITLVVSKNIYTVSGSVQETIGSESVPALKVTVAVNKSLAVLPLEIGDFIGLYMGPDTPIAVPDVLVPAVPGTYFYKFRDASGAFIEGQKIDVIRARPGAPGNTFQQPYEVDEYPADENGNLYPPGRNSNFVQRGVERVYFLGSSAGLTLPPSVTPPQPQQPRSPGSFRLIRRIHHIKGLMLAGT